MSTRVGGVPEHFNLPWEAAVAELRTAGKDVSWRAFPDGSGAMTRALAAREIDVAVMLTTSTLRAIAGGLDARILGTHVPSPLHWGIHVPAGSDLAVDTDIRGRRVAISRFGSGSHLVPIVDAVMRGWAPGELEFVEVATLEGARDALAAGDADVFFWERFMTQHLVDDGIFRRVGVRLPPWPSFLVVAHSEWLHGPDSVDLLSPVSRHCAALAADETTADVIAHRFDLSREQAIAWMALTDWRCVPMLSADALTQASHYLSTALGLDIPPPEDLLAPSCALGDPGH